MALSNTATPIYYGRFRESVLKGEIPVCQEISYEMNRIDWLIANPNFYYDDEAVEGWVRYCENEMTLTDGTPLRLLPSFKLWAEQIFGWYYYDVRSVWIPGEEGEDGHFEERIVKKRLTTKQYLIVARGAAKSLYETLIQSYFLVVDKETTHQITTAPTMKQAEEIMQPFRTAIIRHPGDVFKFLTAGSLQNTTGNRFLRQKLVSTKKGIENFLTNSLLEVRPMSIDKLQGLRPKVSTIDEWLSGDLREDVVGAIEQGASKLPDWLILAVSSEGTVRNGSGDTIKLELAKILRGEYLAEHISIWHYKLDDVKEVDNPAMWIKANPNLGMTVSYETYHQDVKRAEAAPAVRNDILAKRFGIPMEGYTFFFTYEETIPHKDRRGYWEMPCTLGVDLSMGDDFCAFTFLFPLPGDVFGVKVRSYITEHTLAQLPGALRFKYEQFMAEGTLHVMPGTVLDIDGAVFDDLDAHIQRSKYYVLAMGYDPYGAKEFVNKWVQMNGPFGIEKVPQGARTESIPLGELKKYAEKRGLIFTEDLMSFCMGHAVTKEDTNGNRKLLKLRYDQKIDNVSALMDAFVAYKANKEAFE